MSETSEKSEGTKPLGNKAIEGAKKKLEEAKGKVDMGKLFKEFFQNLASGNGKEAFKKFSAIILAVFSGKLAGLKKDVEKTRKDTEEKADSAEAEDEDEEKEEEGEEEDTGTTKTDKPPKAEPSAPIPKIDKAKFRKGELFAALDKHCPYAKIEHELLRPDKDTMTVKGIPGWKKGKNTDDWDYEGAGNTDELIGKGEYKVQGIKRPKGTQKKVPAQTHKKLERIAVVLQHDPRMPLFTAIDMEVDGIKVIMVKEIHCWDKSRTKSKTLAQPHTGTAYIVKS